MKKSIFNVLFIFTLLSICNLTFSIDICMCQWVIMSDGIGSNQCILSLTSSNSNIFAGTYSNGVFRSTNFGITWTTVNSGLTFLTVQSLIIKENYLFAGTAGSGIFLSTNNGENWNFSGLTNQDIYCFALIGSNLFAATFGNGVYLSTNNGVNWNPINNGLTNYFLSTLVSSGNTLFAGTENGVFLSTNSGANWNSVNAGLTNLTVNGLTLSGSSLFAGTWGGGVFRTTNNGTNWNAVNFGLTNQYILTLTSSGANIFAGASGPGDIVYLSTNSGENWFNKDQGFNNIGGVYSLLITNNYIFAGTGNHSVWRRSFSEILGIKPISKNVPSSYSLFQNYPNPFNPTTKIKFDIARIEVRSQQPEVSLKIFDILGREIQTLVNEQLQPGTYEVTFDGSNSPSGIYFYQLKTNNFIGTKKLILLK